MGCCVGENPTFELGAECVGSARSNGPGRSGGEGCSVEYPERTGVCGWAMSLHTSTPRMRPSRTHLLLVLAPLLALPGGGCGADPAGPDRGQDGELDVLFIGNSLTYANDLPGMLESLFEMGGQGPISTRSVVAGGVGLPDHWDAGTATETIREGGWDVVVLQQGPSATEGRPYLLEYAVLFAEEIEAVGARTALYMVWPAEGRYFDFPGVSDSYSTAADLVDGLLFPAGEAWLAAWRRDPGLELYGPDRFHPSLEGTYLAALVMYQQLSGRSPADLPNAIPTGEDFVFLPDDVATTLQEAAQEANERFAR